MTTWHATPDVLAAYASVAPLDPVTAASVEQHLITCGACRAVVADAASTSALSSSWDAIADVIDRPRTTVAERVLTRLGLPTTTARVVSATPGLRLAWLATVAFVSIAAVTIARRAGSESLFLAVAPLLPIGSALLVFLPADEPGGEAAAATPLYGAGVLLRRATATLVPSFTMLGLAGLALPDLNEGARWLLPGLALALGSLALATVIRPVVASAGLALGWIALVVAVQIADTRAVPLAATVLFGAQAQLVSLALATAAGALLYARRDRFATMEVIW